MNSCKQNLQCLFENTSTNFLLNNVKNKCFVFNTGRDCYVFNPDYVLEIIDDNSLFYKQLKNLDVLNMLYQSFKDGFNANLNKQGNLK